MDNTEYLEILKQDVQSFNKWRAEHPKIALDLNGADLGQADLGGAALGQAALGKADLSEAYLRMADLDGADLMSANLSYADLSKVNLRKANLRKADLSGADLSGAILFDAGLNSASLGGAYLMSANLKSAILFDADLSGADLDGADLRGASLSGADLSGAYLSYADLRGASLDRADLSGTNLSRANLSNTNLNQADFSKAKFGYTIIGDIDLSNALGLETIEHEGPSTIGIDTIYRSGGKIPHEFLEGAGVPDIFIGYMGSLTGQALQYYSCFISHSTPDKEFADRIYADLRKEGIRCWFAPEDMKGGKKIHRQLDEAIRFYDKLLLILSEKSINSDWVKNEIRWARKREKQEGKQKLFPVSLIEFEKLKSWELFDADTATDLAAEIRSYFIPDFQNWKNHDDYSVAFKRLVRDLKAEE